MRTRHTPQCRSVEFGGQADEKTYNFRIKSTSLGEPGKEALLDKSVRVD